MDIKTTVKVENCRVKDLLTSAVEGGSNYWGEIRDYDLANGITLGQFDFPHIDVPFKEGCSIIFDDIEGDPDLSNKKLNLETMQNGLQIMADKYPHHFADVMTEQDDASTGDVFLQCSLFGEIVFG